MEEREDNIDPFEFARREGESLEEWERRLTNLNAREFSPAKLRLLVSARDQINEAKQREKKQKDRDAAEADQVFRDLLHV